MKMSKRIMCVVSAITMMTTLSLTGCGTKSSGTGDSNNSKDKPYIAVVAKGFQHQFWQVVMKGAQKAADELGATITFDGPPSESDINQQVNMINSALSKNPVALCLAALDTQAVTSQLNKAKDSKIPVIGFDSGVPNAPAGSVAATAATNNYKAAQLAADKMFADSAFAGKIKAATVDNPVVIGVLSQDATSDSIVQRTKGFLDQMKKNIEGIDGFTGAVDISGQTNYNSPAASGAKVKIIVRVPPTTNATDMQNGARALLGSQGIIGMYASNEGAANGLLSATNDGSDFDKAKGKYKDVTVVGFDAGKIQKNAVANGWFLGSITQDPFSIGYNAVKLAFKAYKGEAVADTDTGAKWYDKTNMNNADIKDLIYD
jgi:ribose transport system substrate-binding protein